MPLNDSQTRRGFIAGTCALALCVATPAQALSSSAAEGLVARAVADVQKAINSGKAERTVLAEFQRIFLRYADVQTVARAVLGQSWRNASSGGKKAYVKAFTGYLARKYGKQFRDFEGAVFTITGSRDAGRKGFLVKSVVKTTKQRAPFEVEWQVSDASGKALIFNMFIEGVSMLTTERGEIRSLLEKSGGDVGKVAQRLDGMG